MLICLYKYGSSTIQTTEPDSPLWTTELDSPLRTTDEDSLLWATEQDRMPMNHRAGQGQGAVKTTSRPIEATEVIIAKTRN